MTLIGVGLLIAALAHALRCWDAWVQNKPKRLNAKVLYRMDVKRAKREQLL